MDARWMLSNNFYGVEAMTDVRSTEYSDAKFYESTDRKIPIRTSQHTVGGPARLRNYGLHGSCIEPGNSTGL